MRVLIFISIIGGIILLITFVSTQNKDDTSKKYFDSISFCEKKATNFFVKMNSIKQRLDYSFAPNVPDLIFLGESYKYIAYKNNNCYAVVQNYNPLINDYRYSILNADAEILEVTIFPFDINRGEVKFREYYKQEFLDKYNILFK